MLFPVRRVVTTIGSNGRSTILSDENSPHYVESGVDRGLVDLWQTSGGRADLGDPDGADRPIRLEPPERGSVFRFFQLAPGGAKTEPSEASESEAFARMGAAHIRVDTSAHHAMHCTKTIDYIVVLKGKVRLQLDDTSTVLNPFDTVIQKGTNHAWINLSDEPALLVAVLQDAGTA